MKLRIVNFGCLFFLLSVFANAEVSTLESDNRETVPKVIESYLGLSLNEIYELFGIPTEVYTVRGIEEWQDDVVFSFNTGLALYLSTNRVWQIQLTKTDLGSCRNLLVGTTLPENPLEHGLHLVMQNEAETIFELEGTAYPVRISAHTTTDGLIQTLYIYRADY